MDSDRDETETETDTESRTHNTKERMSTEEPSRAETEAA